MAEETRKTATPDTDEKPTNWTAPLLENSFLISPVPHIIRKNKKIVETYLKKASPLADMILQMQEI